MKPETVHCIVILIAPRMVTILRRPYWTLNGLPVAQTNQTRVSQSDAEGNDRES